VKQASNFAFVRIYESGHEVPFYQPAAALAIFERAIKGLDIATGTRKVRAGYKTRGPKTSTYREGNSTIQFDVVPTDTLYNTTTNQPDPYNATASADRKVKKSKKRREPMKALLKSTAKRDAELV
jgi:hypothetical protein